MKKILVLGAAGMAGHVIYTCLKELRKHNVAGTTNVSEMDGVHLKMNILNTEEVESVISSETPDIIINCIGMLIRSSKQNPDQTIYGNAYFPHLLKKICEKKGIKLIHISTDCVFSGKTGRYTEHSFKDATDIYGLSKSLGEIIDENNLTIRTSIIGPEIKQQGEGLFHWFMNQSNIVNGYKSNIWSGVTTLELAKFIDWVIENPLTGLVHLTNNQAISKYDLLQIFNDIFEKGIKITDEKDYVCDKSFINSKPEVSYGVASYQDMLEDQKTFMKQHQALYKNIYPEWKSLT